MRELQAILAEEVNRLPEKYRAPFVLCCLEGKSRTEAAGQLGWKEGTVSSRLAEARKRLQRGLQRRGVTLAAALCVESLADASAAVPAQLAHQTIAGAIGIAAGRNAASVAPGTVATLAAGMTRTLYLGKVKLAAILLVVLGFTAAGAGVLIQQTPEASEEPVKSPIAIAQSPRPEPVVVKPSAAEHKDTIAYSGRVLGPDGRPVPGAKLYLTPWYGYPHEPDPSPVYATTGADGRFRLTVPKAKFGTMPTVVAAGAANYGPDWVGIEKDGKRDDLTLRLVPDDGPIVGQVVNLEGRPIAGATFTVMQINAAPKEDLGPWLAAVKAKEGLSYAIEQKYLSRHTIALGLKATTDADGRFRLDGIGRNRLVRGQLDGPTIASQRLCILTRPGKIIEVTEHEGNREYHEPRRVTTYYGSNLRLVAAPCKPIIGVIRDKDTKQPLVGVAVRSYTQATGPSSFRAVEAVVRTMTDAQGRYRLTGLPKGLGYSIATLPGSGQPYVNTKMDVPDSPGLESVTVDFALKRGVWIEGKLTDKATGKPLKGSVEYFSLYSNPNLRDYPGFDGTFLSYGAGAGTKEDGSYRLVGLPGPGLVAVYYEDNYLRAPERDDEYGIKTPFLQTSPYHLYHPVNYAALARIDPPKGIDSVKRDVTLDPGWTFTGTLLGPDGKPLAGARGFSLTSRLPAWDYEGMKTAEFAVRGFNPHRPREILFQHPEKGLVGIAQPPKENGGSVTVRMEPGGDDHRQARRCGGKATRRRGTGTAVPSEEGSGLGLLSP